MIRRRQVLVAGGAAATLAATGLPRPAIAAASKTTLRFVPQAALANPDPIWTTATVATNHGYMVWDTLYGIDNALIGSRRCAPGTSIVRRTDLDVHAARRVEVHRGEPVRGIDCTTSIARWAVKDPFGQQLAAQTEEMKPLDDKRFQIRLKKRFRQMAYALGASSCFIMPERMAKTPAGEQIKEYIGSGPFMFKRDEWGSGAKAAYEKYANYVPRQEKPEYFSGGKVVNFERVEWIVQPDPATASAALQTGEVDWLEFPLLDLLPTLRKSAGARSSATIRSAHWRSSRSITCTLHSTIRSCCARCCRRSTRGNMSLPGWASRLIWATTRWASSPPARRWRTRGNGSAHLAARSAPGEEAGRGERLQGREDRDDVAV